MQIFTFHINNVRSYVFWINVYLYKTTLHPFSFSSTTSTSFDFEKHISHMTAPWILEFLELRCATEGPKPKCYCFRSFLDYNLEV